LEANSKNRALKKKQQKIVPLYLTSCQSITVQNKT